MALYSLFPTNCKVHCGWPVTPSVWIIWILTFHNCYTFRHEKVTNKIKWSTIYSIGCSSLSWLATLMHISCWSQACRKAKVIESVFLHVLFWHSWKKYSLVLTITFTKYMHVLALYFPWNIRQQNPITYLNIS